MKEKIHESDCVSCAKKRRLPKDKKELAVEVQKHLEDIFNSDNFKDVLIISIIGPQSAGKSFLLNILFVIMVMIYFLSVCYC